jgi:hypothetical protein
MYKSERNDMYRNAIKQNQVDEGDVKRCHVQKLTITDSELRWK